MSKVEKTTLFLSGLNVERFINKVINENIKLHLLTRHSYSEVEVKISKCDFDKIKNIASENGIAIVNEKACGILSVKNKCKQI